MVGRVALTIDELQVEIQAKSTGAGASIDALAVSLGKLRSAVKGGVGLTTATKQLNAFSQAVQNMQAPTQKIAELVAALKPLETIGKSNLGSALNQLRKIPDITAGLDDAKLSSFADKIQQVTIAIRPLAAEMEKVSLGFSRLPANIQRAINANARLTVSNRKASRSYGILGTGISSFVAKLTVAYLAVRRVARIIGDWIDESNRYIEDLNLFYVTMGEYADGAKEYAERVGDLLGIDPREFMRYQGVFQNMVTGFGVASDKAVVMSKNLTQLGYDLASVFNVKFDVAMEKLQSAISGQPRPMREWGFDLSEATLKAVALEKGIKKNVETMSQMEKSQLRYVQLLETAQRLNLTGDFARTIEAPANQLRVLAANATQAARALGNIFIPVLNAVLPYAIAFLKVVRMVANEIANLFGFTLPEIDYSGLGGLAASGEDAEDALGGAADAAKELKRATLGIDELNVISPQSVAGGVKGSGVGSDLGFELPEYDFLADVLDSKVSGIFEKWKEKVAPFVEWVTDNFRTISNLAVDIGVALAAWKLAKSVINGITSLNELATNLPKLSKGLRVAAGLVISIAGVKWSYEAGFEVGRGTAEFMDYVKSIIGPIAAGVGGALIGSTIMPGIGTTAGFIIGMSVGLLVEVVGMIKGQQQRLVDKFYETDFGKEVAVFKEHLKDSLAVTEELRIRVDSITTEIDPEALANLTLAQQLLDDIFSLAEKETLTSSELALITEKVNILNGMGLEGLRIDLDPDGKIKQTKNELQGVIEKLYEQYRLEAAKDSLVEAYRAQYDALTDVTKKNDDFTKSMELYNIASEEADRLLTELLDTEKELNEILAQGKQVSEDYLSWPNEIKDSFDPLVEKTLELQKQLDEQNIILGEVKPLVDSANEALKSSLSVYDDATDKVKNIETAFADLTKAVAESKDVAVTDAEEVMNGFAEGLENGEDTIQTAMNQALTNLYEYERLFNGISSPSKLYATEGLYLMQGFAQGITKNTNLVTDAMNSLLNELITKMQEFTNRCRVALNSMLSDFSSAMANVNITASGSVSYDPITTKTIPRFAAGGFPAPGQMFVASEAGPEMVGTIGSRTAVANNDQIVEAVASGVYEAVVSAIARSGGESQPALNVYLEGKQINTTIRKTERERGVGIMRGGVLNG